MTDELYDTDTSTKKLVVDDDDEDCTYSSPPITSDSNASDDDRSSSDAYDLNDIEFHQRRTKRVRKLQLDAEAKNRIRLEKLRQKYAPALEECYEAIGDKLTWLKKDNDDDKKKELLSATPNDENRSTAEIDRTDSRNRGDAVIGSMANCKITENTAGRQQQNRKTQREFVNTASAAESIRSPKRWTNERAMPSIDITFNKTGTSKIVSQEIPDDSRKHQFCLNAYRSKDGRCRFGNRCVYSHSLTEIANFVIPCKFGVKCRYVQRRIDGDADGTVTYVRYGDFKCSRTHPKESIEAYVRRTCENY